MIGSGLKKYAQENGLKVAKGVAYGAFRGYAATMSEGSGFKQVFFTTKFTQAGADDALLAELNAANIQRTYRVQQLNVAPNGIRIVFTDTIGTMNKIKEFMDWFMPLLEKHGATKWNTCTECGAEVTDGHWILIAGVAYYMHGSCANSAKMQIQSAEQMEKEQDTGSYTTGAIGAFLGAAIGAIAWGFVYYSGFVASLIGLAIGFVAEKGYSLLKGKNGKGKVVILILAVIFGVLAGTAFGFILMIIRDVINVEGSLFTHSDIPDLVAFLLQDPEIKSGLLKDTALGLLFAALGVFAMLKKTSQEVSDTKIIDLE